MGDFCCSLKWPEGGSISLFTGVALLNNSKCGPVEVLSSVFSEWKLVLLHKYVDIRGISSSEMFFFFILMHINQYFCRY